MRMTKPWVALDTNTIAALPAQLGVYELGDDDGTTLKIGYAGGTEPFGMRSALTAELAASSHASTFRHEFTHGYMTRWQELLMVFEADHGTLPVGNADRAGRLGRLNPGGAG